MDTPEYYSLAAKAIGIKEGKVTFSQIIVTADGKCLLRLEIEPTPKQKKKLVDLMFLSLRGG